MSAEKTARTIVVRMTEAQAGALLRAAGNSLNPVDALDIFNGDKRAILSAQIAYQKISAALAKARGETP